MGAGKMQFIGETNKGPFLNGGIAPIGNTSIFSGSAVPKSGYIFVLLYYSLKS
jgi:hypothetical protein